MNKPRLVVECWECKTPVKITRLRLAQVGQYPKCQTHEKQFLSWLGNLYKEQN
jgi:Cdc6-like AAA superfamily ATPase